MFFSRGEKAAERGKNEKQFPFVTFYLIFYILYLGIVDETPHGR